MYATSNIGENIRKFRKKANLTQKELAEKCGLAEITIRQYETGKREPRFNQQKLICSALGITLSDLLFKESFFINDKKEAQNFKAQLIKLMQQVNDSNLPEQRKKESIEKYKLLIAKNKELEGMLDLAIEKETECKEATKSLELEYEKFEEAKHEYEELFFSLLQLLNEDGQCKLMEFLELLLKIPEYRADIPPDQEETVPDEAPSPNQKEPDKN